MKFLGFAASLISLYAIVACSASVTSSGNSSSGDEGGKGGAASGAGGEGGEGGRIPCDLQEKDACLQCCTDEHSVGSEKLDILFYTYCGCDRRAPCAKFCDTPLDEATNLCVDDDVFNFEIDNEDCTSCLQEIADKGEDPCLTDVQDDCKNISDCIAFGKCQLNCPAE